MFDSHDLFRSLHTLPTPIAQPLRRVQRSARTGGSGAALLETTHQTLHLLTTFAAADISSADAEDTTLAEALDAAYSGTNPERWWTFLQTWAEHRVGTHLPELQKAVLGKGSQGEKWIHAIENLTALMAEPGLGRSAVKSAASHLTSASTQNDLGTFIRGLDFLEKWSLLTPCNAWEDENEGNVALASRFHGYSPEESGVLIKRLSGAFHEHWPVLIHHETGHGLSLFPLLSLDEETNQLKLRALFNKAESNSKTGATRERWWGERTCSALLPRLQTPAHALFQVSEGTLTRLATRGADETDASAKTYWIGSPYPYRIGVNQDEKGGYEWSIGLTGEASLSPLQVAQFKAATEEIRAHGRGMLRTEALYFDVDTNHITANAYSSSGFPLSEFLNETEGLPFEAATLILDSLFDALIRAIKGGYPLTQFSLANVLVSEELEAQFFPLPLVATPFPMAEPCEGLIAMITALCPNEPRAEALKQELAAGKEEGLKAVLTATRALLPDPLPTDTPDLALEASMTLTQMVSPGEIGQRLRDLEAADPTESDVVEGLRYLAAETWNRETRCTLLNQALAHPFADLQQGRKQEVSLELLSLVPTHEEASAVREQQLRQEEDWSGVADHLLTRFSQAKKNKKSDILRALCQVFETKLESPESAFLVARRALEDNPQDETSLTEAIRIAEQAGLWEELFELLVDISNHLPTEAKAITLLDAATIAAQQLGRSRGAIAVLEEVLTLRNTDGEAWALYGHMLMEVGDFSTAVTAWQTAARNGEGPARVMALSNAANCAEKASEWQRCIQLLELQAVAEDRVSSAHTCARIAEICMDKLNDLPHADSALARARALAPDDPEVAAAVAEVSSRSSEALREVCLSNLASTENSPADREAAVRAALRVRDQIQLGKPEAAGLFLELIEVAPTDIAVLTAYYELLIELEDYAQAVEILAQRSELASSSEERSMLLLEQAQLIRTNLADPVRASHVLKEAASLLPGDKRITKAQLSALREANDWEGILETLLRKAERSRGMSKAEALIEAGRISLENRDSSDDGIGFLEQALEEIPGHLDAAHLLATEYLAINKPAKALPLLTVRAESADSTGNEAEALKAWATIGELSINLELWERASQAYTRAYTLSPKSAMYGQGLAKAKVALGERDEAAGLYRELLQLPPNQLAGNQKAAIQQALGQIAADSGSIAESRALLEETLRTSEPTRDLLEQLVSVCKKEGDWEATVRYQQDLLPLQDNQKAKFALLLKQADMQANNLADGEGAIQSLQQALLIEPESRVCLATLLEVALTNGAHGRAVEALQRLANLETDGERKASHLLASAILYRDHLHDELKTVGLLHEALDANPLLLEAFEALDSILVKRMDFNAQADSYERMLSRVSKLEGTEDLSYRLLMNHASLLRKLNKLPEAIFALEKARILKPEELEVHQKLARNLEESEDSADEAIDAYYTLLRRDPHSSDAFRALRRLFTRQKETDGAWCACGALVHLGIADDNEKTYYETHLTGSLKVKRTLEEEGPWLRHLYPSGMNPFLGQLMDAVFQRHADWFISDSLEELGLDESNRIELSRKGSFTNFARTVPRILGVRAPSFYASDVLQGIRKASLDIPTAIVASDMVANARGKQLRFQLGRAMTLFHPFHTVAGIRNGTELQGLMNALYLLYHDWNTTDALAQRLRGQLGEGELENYATMVPAFFEENECPMVQEWLDGVEVAAARAGLLLCNDVHVAIKELESGNSLLGNVPPGELVNQVLRFCVSRDYHALRAELGISI